MTMLKNFGHKVIASDGQFQPGCPNSRSEEIRREQAHTSAIDVALHGRVTEIGHQAGGRVLVIGAAAPTAK